MRELLFDKILSEYEIRINELYELEWIMNDSKEVMMLLSEIPFRIRLYFGDVDLGLRVCKNIVEDYSYLMVVVKTNKSVFDALNSLESFGKDWWLDISLGIDVPITINTEYI